RDLLTAARNAETQRNVEVLVADAAALHQQKEDDKSLAAVQKVLDLDPGNQAAKSIRDEIELSRDQNKTQAEQDSYVKATVGNAQELFNAGKFEEASKKIEEVIRVRPDDGAAVNLNRRIAIQLEAGARMNSERSQWEQAKTAAITARAPELDQPRFAAAQRAEEIALKQQGAKQFDQAARRFAEAAGLYRDAERAARAELLATVARETDAQNAAAKLQRTQAEQARTQYEQSRVKAHDAEAETRAGDAFQAAARLAQDAQARLDRGDFAGARSQFDAAS